MPPSSTSNTMTTPRPGAMATILERSNSTTFRRDGDARWVHTPARSRVTGYGSEDGSGSDLGVSDKYFNWPLFRRHASSRQLSSRALTPNASTSKRFADPLVREGAGSVFPVDLPLSQRREHEVELIQRFDRLAINPNVGDFWLIVDAGWMGKWIDFAMGRTDPPGPISNLNLFDQIDISDEDFDIAAMQEEAVARAREGGAMLSRPDLTLKKGLQRVKDYRAVHPLVWYMFREIYDTDDAPVLCRWKPDLYADDVVVSRRIRVKESMHVKAAYELRRFSAKVKAEARADKEREQEQLKTHRRTKSAWA